MTPYYEKNGITIYCGDSDVIRPTIPDIDSIISDVPYGVDFDTDYTRFSNAKRSDLLNTHRRIKGDKKPFDPTHLLEYNKVTIFGANNFSLPNGTFLVWDKRASDGDSTLMADAEIAWLNTGHGVYIFRHTWGGFKRASERGTSYHPSQKPVVVMQWLLKRTNPRGLICDPYMGSGSTLVAAQNMGYQAVGIELDEDYCKIAVERLRQQSLFSVPETKKPEVKQGELF